MNILYPRTSAQRRRIRAAREAYVKEEIDALE